MPYDIVTPLLAYHAQCQLFRPHCAAFLACIALFERAGGVVRGLSSLGLLRGDACWRSALNTWLIHSRGPLDSMRREYKSSRVTAAAVQQIHRCPLGLSRSFRPDSGPFRLPESSLGFSLVGSQKHVSGHFASLVTRKRNPRSCRSADA